MIHFACKQCGQPLVHPDDAVGTLVFCQCGQGNQVPAASVDPGTAPARTDLPPAQVVSAEPAANPFAELTREPAREPAAVKDPNRCFNHPDVPAEQTCDACGEVFCAACLVMLQERILCGPCKNFHLRVLQRPAQVPGLAITSLLLTFAMALCGHCVLFMGAESRQSGTMFFSLLPQVVALIIGAMAVHQVETKPRATGRAFAMTGLLTAFVVCIELILFAIFLKRQVV